MLGILIADDESIVAFDIKRTLRSFGFDKIIVARNGSEAVEKTRTGNPDLIIMDIMMGHDMNGIDAARVINNQGKKKPIIFVTASTDEKTLSEAQETNPIEIIRKPFSEYQLKDAILKAVTKFYRGTLNPDI